MDLAYYWYDAAHLMMAPARAASESARFFLDFPGNPLTYTPYGRTMSAAFELFERTTRRYAKPGFGFTSTVVEGESVPVTEEVVWSHPFCQVIAFRRGPKAAALGQPKLLIVAPMSGHYATLLRGTVEAFLPTHEVMITDWADAKTVPVQSGTFDLDSYIDYVMEMCRDLGPDLHVLAVCQPAVPVIAAVARLEAQNDPAIPLSAILMGGPIDTRRSPTAVNQLAEERGAAWFAENCIQTVPFGHPGAGRQVYPGFFQLSGFMAMNLDRHMTAHREMFDHLVRGDGDQAEKHRDFYDEYMAVMDLTAEFYLQTVETVFVTHDLPRGEMMHRGERVDLLAIRRCALMAVEGEKDDISGVGQTLATLELTPNLSPDKKLYHLQTEVGHYGVFNGSRFRKQIAPKIVAFTQAHARDAKPAVSASLVVPASSVMPDVPAIPASFPSPAESAVSGAAIDAGRAANAPVRIRKVKV